MAKAKVQFKTIFENGQLLVLDKPAGLVVNLSETTKEETLQDQLSLYFHLNSGDFGIGGRAGIVHRLDKETSGVLMVAKNRKTFDYLQQQFQERKVQKEYIGLVHGLIKEKEGIVDVSIGRIGKFGKFGEVKEGREAQTTFGTIERYFLPDKNFDEMMNKLKECSSLNKSRINFLKNHARNYTLASFFPKTGRTHQIRVHAKSMGHPLVSDLIYTPSKLLKSDLLWCERLFLHAKKIAFIDPFGKNVVFEASLPYDLRKALAYLKKLPHA